MNSKVTVRYNDPTTAGIRSRYLIQTEIGPVFLKEIVFYASFWVENPRELTPEASQYARVTGDRISKSARYFANVGSQKTEFGIHQIDDRPGALFVTAMSIPPNATRARG
jgi:hypothetical protein